MTTINFCQYSCAKMFGQKYLDVRLFLDITVWCCHLLSMNCATLCPCIYATLCPCIVQLYVHVLCNFMSMYCATLCPYIVQPSVDPIIVQLYVHVLWHVLCNFMSMYCATLCPYIYVFVLLYVHVLCNFFVCVLRSSEHSPQSSCNNK